MLKYIGLFFEFILMFIFAFIFLQMRFIVWRGKMSELLIDWLMEVFSNLMPAELFVFLISMLPVLELRGGLIAAALLDIPIAKAALICFVGNILPIPFILLLTRPIFAWLKQTKLFRPMVEKLETRAMGKSDQIRMYEFWGLLIFVGIPLPGTGAWTGAMIAAMLNISIKRAMPPITLGVCMAGVIMCVISYVIPWMITSL